MRTRTTWMPALRTQIMVSRGKQRGPVPGWAGTLVMSLCLWVPPALPPRDHQSHRTGMCTPEDAETCDSRQSPGSHCHPARLHLRGGTVRNSQETWGAPKTAAVNPEMGDCPRNVGQVLVLVTEMSLSAQQQSKLQLRGVRS